MLASAICPYLDAILPPGGALAGRLFSRMLGNEADDPLAPGTRVGCWRIARPLGSGGSSTVYLAERADGHFEQRAALKIVRRGRNLIDPFRRERQILANLCHPAIARLIDGGQIEGGRLWLAMEPVFGERIDDHVRNRGLPLGERISLFDAVCDAVAYAHDRALIHGDIKPGNLLVDETGRPRLLDFGIASAGEVEAGGYRAMTPTYASPEQHAGEVVTVASDIYQLGALLRILVMPEGDPCRTLPCMPCAIATRELTAIVARATANEPARRYASVSALRRDLAAMRLTPRVPLVGGTALRFIRFFERRTPWRSLAPESSVIGA